MPAHTRHTTRTIWRRGVRGLLWTTLALLLLFDGALAWMTGGFGVWGNSATVSGGFGTVQGWSLPESRVFVGVPYAQSTGGEGRFAPPLPLPTQPDSRTLALLPSAPCAQAAAKALGIQASQEEDCLTLNIFTPSESATNTPRPVIVWIHGGGFVTGANWHYIANEWAARGDAVIVSISYRLGALGFLTHPAFAGANVQTSEPQSPEHNIGNYGLLDQQLALRWVQQHIAAFGGDPNNVTLAGQSAGAISVCAHLASPPAQGVFHKALIMSGNCGDTIYLNPQQALEQGARIAQQLGCTGNEDAIRTCLRQLPIQRILDSMGRVNIRANAWYAPTYGTATLPLPPMQRIAQGTHHRVPVMVGSTQHEGTLIEAIRWNDAILQAPDDSAIRDPQRRYTEAAYQTRLAKQFPLASDAKLDDIRTRYPFTNANTNRNTNAQGGFQTHSALYTDTLFACPSHQLRDALAQHNNSNIYGYEFTETDAPSILLHHPSQAPLGAYHGAEIPYLFYNPMAALPNDAHRTLRHQLIDAFSHFARHGTTGVAEWTPYQHTHTEQETQTSDNTPHNTVYQFNTQGNATTHDFATQHQCDYWLSSQAPPAAHWNDAGW